MANQDRTTYRTQDVARYGALNIGLHWLMLLLIAAVYALMELRGIFPKGSDGRVLMMNLHYSLGLSVFALAVIRVLVNLSSKAPAIVPDPPGLQKRLAKLVQLALYVLMLGLPLAGWLTLSAKGAPIPFFGLQLPALIAASESTARLIKDVHETGAAVGYFLIGLHSAAALWHHYFMRDNTLLRMLPGQRSPR